ncbi:hypothetical protein FNYG_08690 [Fusarium nygamai]|uniref:Uncharacterized protein n=1 Tax=Gibberella nygamai TaxID=42673 RepID=A0A2K0W6S6_GIBNY|nr:hypothetical protein FNYG_08690 [Fusarium nygamai]
MSSLPAAASANAGSGQAANGDTFESLRQRLHEAEHTITGLKATQDFVMAQNAELKKENNQLQEDMAVLRSQNSQAGNNGNEAVAGTSVTPSPEDVKNLQECLQEIKHESKEINLQSQEVHRQSEEVRRQTVKLRDCVLSKQDEFSRKRRRTDSEANMNEEESSVMQFLKTCKRYNSQTARCSITFNSTLERFIEDLCIVYATRTAVCHGKRRQNLEMFLNSKNKPGWHCLREVCEKGKLSTEAKNFVVCPHHGSDCEFLIEKQQPGQGRISFAAFGDLKSLAK